MQTFDSSNRPFFTRNQHIIIAAIAFLGITYNAIFAFVYSNVGIISDGHVIMAEMAISFAGLSVILIKGIKENDKLIMMFAVTVGISVILIYIASSLVAVNMIRNFLIVIIFTMLGYRLSKQVYHRLVYTIAIIVLSILIIEITYVEAYVSLFSPARYYEATRGIEIKGFNDTGLFGNALSFEGRFNFGFFNTHRTSSIFLEQVSFANFLSVLAIYTATFWRELSANRKTIYLTLIILGLLTNNSRTSSTVAVICFLLYNLYAFLPSAITLIRRACFITTFSVASIVAMNNDFIYSGDNFEGRLSLGMGRFYDLDALDYLGFGWNKIDSLWDSGFGYLIASSTIFAAFGFIAFIHLYLSSRFRNQLLFSTLLIIYISLNLVIGGNAIYSMKTAPLLWMAFGFLKSEESSDEAVENTNLSSLVLLGVYFAHRKNRLG